MMRRDLIRFPQEQIAIRSPHEAVEQAVPVKMTGFFFTKEKSDATIAMDTETHVREALHLFFQGADSAQPAR